MTSVASKSFGLFRRFLTLSGLGTPFAYLWVFVLEPIADRIGNRIDPPAKYQAQAAAVRNVVSRTGLEYFPFLLDVREMCPTCDEFVLMLVQPNSVCWTCWRIELMEKHKIILAEARKTGLPPLLPNPDNF